MSRGIRRQRDGTWKVRLPAGERDVLAALPAQLREAIEAEEPSVRRLFPPAYEDDDEADEDYRRLVGSSLSDGKLAALAELERTAHADTLTDAELASWLGALESLRLVLGTQLDVTEEGGAAVDPSDPEGRRLQLYHWLSYLQEEVVRAMSAALR